MIDTSWSCSTSLRLSRLESSSLVRAITSPDVSASTVVAPAGRPGALPAAAHSSSGLGCHRFIDKAICR